MNNEKILEIIEKIYEKSNGSLNYLLDIKSLIEDSNNNEEVEDVNNRLLYLREKGFITGPKPLAYQGMFFVKNFKITSTLIDYYNNLQNDDNEIKVINPDFSDKNAIIKKESLIICLDMANSTGYKDRFHKTGDWESIVKQLGRVHEWISQIKPSYSYINFTGDGFIVVFSNDISKICKEFENPQSDISFNKLLTDLLEIRKDILTKRDLREFNGHSHDTLLSFRISIHKSIDDLLGVNGSHYIGPDIDFATRLNKPKEFLNQNSITWNCPWNVNLEISSPIFISEHARELFDSKKLTFLGTMNGQGVESISQDIYIHHESNTIKGVSI